EVVALDRHRLRSGGGDLYRADLKGRGAQVRVGSRLRSGVLSSQFAASGGAVVAPHQGVAPLFVWGSHWLYSSFILAHKTSASVGGAMRTYGWRPLSFASPRPTVLVSRSAATCSASAATIALSASVSVLAI